MEGKRTRDGSMLIKNGGGGGNDITQLFVGDPVPDKSRYERQKLFGRCRR